jgi:hypothetical protein
MSRKFYRQRVSGDSGLLFLAILKFAHNHLVETGQYRSKRPAVFSYSFMDEVALLGQPDDESLFFPLLQELIVELSPCLLPDLSCDIFVAQIVTHHVDHFEKLDILAREILCFLGLCLPDRGE